MDEGRKERKTSRWADIWMPTGDREPEASQPCPPEPGGVLRLTPPLGGPGKGLAGHDASVLDQVGYHLGGGHVRPRRTEAQGSFSLPCVQPSVQDQNLPGPRLLSRWEGDILAASIPRSQLSQQPMRTGKCPHPHQAWQPQAGDFLSSCSHQEIPRRLLPSCF